MQLHFARRSKDFFVAKPESNVSYQIEKFGVYGKYFWNVAGFDNKQLVLHRPSCSSKSEAINIAQTHYDALGQEKSTG